MAAKRRAAAVATRAEPDPIAGASVSLLAVVSGGGITGMDENGRGLAFGAFDARQEIGRAHV